MVTLAPLLAVLYFVIRVMKSSNKFAKTFRDMNDASVTFGTLSQLTGSLL